MTEIHLKQPGFTYGTCGPFTKHCERIQKFRKTGKLKHLYRKELAKASSAHEAAYSDNKCQRTISDKVLKDITFEIARNCNNGEFQRPLASMVEKFFIKKQDQE